MAPNRTLGLLLIAIGSALLLVMVTDLGGEVFVLLIGAGFVGAYVLTRAYGFLVPGAILAGLGTGILVESWGGPSEAVTLGLGTGFLAIAVVDRLRGSTGSGWWWPLIPGSILTITAASTMTGIRDLGSYLLPAALIIVGAVLLVRRGGATATSSTGSAVDHPADRADDRAIDGPSELSSRS
jgi:hypothetical protein